MDALYDALYETAKVRPVARRSGLLAQLVRAPRLHRGGRGFESLTAHPLTPSGGSDEQR